MERIIMFKGWNRLGQFATSGAAALIGITMLANAWALDPCRLPTPCPCKAEGVCRPNELEWGHYQTRWRSWPGESKQVGATPDSADPSQDPLLLKPFEHPMPEEEDLRGPAKTTTDRSRGETGAAEAGEVPVQPLELPVQPLELPIQPLEQPIQPLDQPVQPQPGEQEEVEFPDFELQGFQDEMPIQLNDAPPTLPTSLQQAEGPFLGNPIAPGKIVQPKRVRRAQASLPQQRTRPVRLPQVTERYHPVVQANVDMSKRLELVNPAARTLMPDSQLHGAVFYESFDLPPSFPGE
jgi:hypothetical protein